MIVRTQGQPAKPSTSARRRSARSVRRHRSRAAFVCTVASLSLIAQFAVVAHALLVPHTTCLEHGAVGHETDHAHATPASDAGPASTLDAMLRADARHAVEDEHCEVLGTHHTAAPEIFAAGLTDRPAPAAAVTVEAPSATSAPAPYRLAPKTSPPRA